jgi:hypothetical protein
VYIAGCLWYSLVGVRDGTVNECDDFKARWWEACCILFDMVNVGVCLFCCGATAWRGGRRRTLSARYFVMAFGGERQPYWLCCVILYEDGTNMRLPSFCLRYTPGHSGVNPQRTEHPPAVWTSLFQHCGNILVTAAAARTRFRTYY